jgi:DHA1 family bicyclomycin/chloramphenicol resistance-like MFS transporter
MQAVGGCGGLVLGLAIVRDSAGPGGATSRMALLTMVQSLAPGVGPAVGGFLGAWFGWRSIFVMLVALGLVTLAGVVLALPETAASRGSGRMLRGYPQLLRSRTFCGYLFGGAFTSTTFFAYLTASPFIFTDMLNRPATEVGLYYLVVLAGVSIGSFSSSRLARRVPSVLLLHATSAIALAGAALFFVVAAIGNLTVVTVLGPMILFSVGVGAASPVAITAAISTDPQLIGSASGLYGFIQTANGAVCTLIVGLIPADPALAAATVLLAGLLLGQSFFLPPGHAPSLPQTDPRPTALSCPATFMPRPFGNRRAATSPARPDGRSCGRPPLCRRCRAERSAPDRKPERPRS